MPSTYQQVEISGGGSQPNPQMMRATYDAERVGVDLLGISRYRSSEFMAANRGREDEFWSRGLNRVFSKSPAQFRLHDDARTSVTIQHLFNREEDGIVYVLFESNVEVASRSNKVDGKHLVELLQMCRQEVATL